MVFSLLALSMTDEMYKTPQSFLAQTRQQNHSISGNQLGNPSSFYPPNQNSSGHNSHFENSSLGINPQNNHVHGSYRNTRRGNEENHADSSQNSINDQRLSEENGIDRIEDITNDVRRKLIESGQFERLNELVERRLSEVGWRLRMVASCQEIIKKQGTAITFDELYNELKPSAKKNVPDEVKKELTQKIKDCYEKVRYSTVESD